MGQDDDSSRREPLRDAQRRWRDARQPAEHPSAEVVEVYLAGEHE